MTFEDKMLKVATDFPPLKEDVETVLGAIDVDFVEDLSLKDALIDVGTVHKELRPILRRLLGQIEKTVEVQEEDVPHDSTQDTLEHIGVVQGFMLKCVSELVDRAMVHDQSKLQSPEKEIFDEFTPATS